MFRLLYLAASAISVSAFDWDGNMVLRSADDVAAALQQLPPTQAPGTADVKVQGGLKILGASLDEATLEPLLTRIKEAGYVVVRAGSGRGHEHGIASAVPGRSHECGHRPAPEADSHHNRSSSIVLARHSPSRFELSHLRLHRFLCPPFQIDGTRKLKTLKSFRELDTVMVRCPLLHRSHGCVGGRLE